MFVRFCEHNYAWTCTFGLSTYLNWFFSGGFFRGKVFPFKHVPISFFLPNCCYFSCPLWTLEVLGQHNINKPPRLLEFILSFSYFAVVLQQSEIESKNETTSGSTAITTEGIVACTLLSDDDKLQTIKHKQTACLLKKHRLLSPQLLGIQER